jgi:Mitochondrial mRNA-processing protein COX24, C-terminal
MARVRRHGALRTEGAGSGGTLTPGMRLVRGVHVGVPVPLGPSEGGVVGSVIKKRRKRMAKKKHRKLLKKTRIQRRNKK